MRRLLSVCAVAVACCSAFAGTGLRFPDNSAVDNNNSSSPRFRWQDPGDTGTWNGGLSILGESLGGGAWSGATYIWMYYPEQHTDGVTRYHSTFFHSCDDNTGALQNWYDCATSTLGALGAHPYPSAAPVGSSSYWSMPISSDVLRDGTDGLFSGPAAQVVEWDRWYTQGLRVYVDGSGFRHYLFYLDLPSVADEDVIDYVNTNSSTHSQDHANQALNWGGAPHAPGQEVGKGIHRGIRIYNSVLTEADLLLESSNPLSTASGAANIWYMNMNPTPTDIADDSGNSNDPSWVSQAARPTLWESASAGIDALPAGHWMSISSNTVSDVNPCPGGGCSYSGSSGQPKVIDAWCGGAFATEVGTSGSLILWGGGHRDYFGTEIYVFDIDAGLWTRRTEPLAYSESTCLSTPGDMGDGVTPCVSHTYDGVEYDPITNKFFTITSQTGQDTGGQSGFVYSFDFDTDTWDKEGDNNTPGYGSTAYDSSRQALWASIPSASGYADAYFSKYDIATETWTRYQPINIEIDTVAAIDPTRDIYVILDGGYQHILRGFDLASPATASTVLSVSGDTAPMSVGKTAFEWDPAIGKFVTWIGGTSVYTLTPPSGDWRTGTWVWDEIIAAAGNTVTPSTPNTNGEWGRWRYVPDKDVFVIVNSTTTDVYAYRLSDPIEVGTLVHDGPATPEQLSLYLPVTGTVAQTATATVRYKETTSGTWITGHPMYRIRPEYTATPGTGSVPDAFAWTIIDLDPGTAYDVEVAVTEGSGPVLRTGEFTTRALPAAAGSANKSIAAGTSSLDIQNAFNALVAGDVLQFANGSYTVDSLRVTQSGTSGSPIYIRGASRGGVVLTDTNGTIINIDASNVILENMTLQGLGSDGGTGGGHKGIYGNNGTTLRSNITVRDVTINGADLGVTFYFNVEGVLVYNNTLNGNNTWTTPFLTTSLPWDDDGISLPGTGNVAFQNTLTGFGDSFAYASHAGSYNYTYAYGVHYYRNDIRNSLDDLVEWDYGHRNISFYDNRSHNSQNCDSIDPLYGGPALYARNICINPSRVNTHKWNTAGSGQFYYNNTFIQTVSATGADLDVSGWYQPSSGGAQQSYGFRNNLSVYRGAGNMLWLESTDHDPIDWTHNSWYSANDNIQWDSVYTDIADAFGSLAATTAVFSGETARMTGDNNTVTNPWTTTVTLGANSLTEVTSSYTPWLTSGTTPKNSGVVIPGITDGYSGALPDRGALIEGITEPAWGDPDATRCGNGIQEIGEECDDGNTSSGDGCDSNCQLETGTTCGNGTQEIGEACDDGNLIDGDCCSALCEYETGSCTDGLYCTVTDTCDGAGTCVGTARDCSDAFACTTDTCNDTTDACVRTPVDAVCDDTLWCTGTETCSASLGCVDGADPVCTDTNACTVDTCNDTTDSCDNILDLGLPNCGVKTKGLKIIGARVE